MNNTTNFSDLEEDIWDGTAPQIGHQHTKGIITETVTVTIFTEDCPKCRGTGNWRPGYRCFKCKGTGTLSFKTSADARSKGRKSAAKSAGKKVVDMAVKWAAWCEAHEAIDGWFTTQLNLGNQFARSLYQGGQKYGHLTEGQERAVYTAIARDEDGASAFQMWCKDHDGVMGWLETQVEAGNEFAGSLMAAGIRYGSLTDSQLRAVQTNMDQVVVDGKESELDLSDLVKGFYAVPDGDTRLKIAIRRPGKNSRWMGWTFVDDGAEYGNRRTYGKQSPDGMYAGAIQDELRAVLADPMAAMIAYGKLTGTCGKCGRILEDEQSVAAGIGPICAAKMG